MSRYNPWVVVALVVATVYATNSFSMRCGNQLILEGDRVEKVISACGEPTSDSLSTLGYHNLDGSGMSYYIHIDNGVVERIDFTRG